MAKLYKKVFDFEWDKYTKAAVNKGKTPNVQDFKKSDGTTEPRIRDDKFVKQIYQYFTGIRCKPATEFNESVCLEVYATFKATHVLDPFAGWGNRLHTAIAADIDYTGVDLNPDIELSYGSLKSHYVIPSNQDTSSFDLGDLVKRSDAAHVNNHNQKVHCPRDSC